MKISYYLDKRNGGKVSPLKIAIRKHGATAFLPTGISLEAGQWDAVSQRVVKHPLRNAYNSFLLHRYLDVSEAVLAVQQKPLQEIKAYLAAKFCEAAHGKPSSKQSFVAFFRSFIATRNRARTRSIYTNTLSLLQQWCPTLDGISFDDVTKQRIEAFDRWCDVERGNAINTRAIHLRNIRAVFNAAIDEGVTTCYPFRRLKIKNAATAKRALSVSDLCRLFAAAPTFQRGWWAKDVFQLMVYLRGINFIDLSNLTPSDVSAGRISYRRAKTGRLYDVKIEPEAAVIIDRLHSTSGKYLLNILDRYSTYRVANYACNIELHRLLPDVTSVTTYWARHTWATIAAELDVPKETIAAGLGHGQKSVTDIYIDFDCQKVDDANRKIIDYVNEMMRNSER